MLKSINDTCAKFDNNIRDKNCIGNDVEHSPLRCRVLVEKRNCDW